MPAASAQKQPLHFEDQSNTVALRAWLRALFKVNACSDADTFRWFTAWGTLQLWLCSAARHSSSVTPCTARWTCQSNATRINICLNMDLKPGFRTSPSEPAG